MSAVAAACLASAVIPNQESGLKEQPVFLQLKNGIIGKENRADKEQDNWMQWATLTIGERTYNTAGCREGSCSILRVHQPSS